MLRNHWNYRRGDIYLADLGAHPGYIQGDIRPGINSKCPDQLVPL